ncbi:MAG: TonB-dependent receptor [Fodinibius sp.]|nr:TonB-dependent receptor [Fodinibius sp.]
MNIARCRPGGICPTGCQGSRRAIESTDRGNHSDWHYAAFSMVQWQPVNPLTMSGSLRLDHDENYGTELMPQLSMSYQQEKWILRAAAGRSVRAPSYTERFISTNLNGPLAGGRNLGNPWLEAERAWSGELGGDLFFKVPYTLLGNRFCAQILEPNRLCNYQQ